MSYLLFLDDVRDPYKSVRFPEEYELLERILAKDYNEFIQTIQNKGLPKVVSFDFDLCPDHYKIGEQTNFTSLKGYNQCQNKTGLHCAQYLIDYCEKHKKKLPKWFCHSMNPVGRQNITLLLKKYEEKQNATKN